MTNVKTTVKDNKLIIEVDLKQDNGPSKSGKTIVVATSHGFARVNDDVSLSLNVTRRKN